MKTTILTLLTIIGLVSSASAELVGYWAFNEGSGTVAFDLSAYGNHGNIGNNVTWTTGKYGAALDFSDSFADSILIIPDDDSLDISNEYTIMMWIRPGVTSNGNVLISKWGVGTGNSFQIHVEGSSGINGYKFIGEIFPSGILGVESLLPVSVHNWSHIAVTFTGGEIKFYINGHLTNFRFHQRNILTSDSDIIIAGIEGINNFDGDIDEVRIYNHALTPNEVLLAMNYEFSPGGELPVAIASEEGFIEADPNVLLTLDGNASFDPDGSIVNYKWTRQPDDDVICAGPNPLCDIKPLGRVKEFMELEVMDNNGNIAKDTVTIIDSLSAFLYILSQQ